MSECGANSDRRLCFDLDDLPVPAFSVALNRRITTWNAGAERLFSLRTADVLGRFCFEVMAKRVELRSPPCSSCALAGGPTEWEKKVPCGQASAAPSFRTFSARSASGEVQLVHLLAGGALPEKSDRPLLVSSGEREPPSVAPSLLTPREREVLRLLAEGLTTIEIADRLSISRITARNHVTHVMDKLEVKSRLRAVVVATHLGLL